MTCASCHELLGSCKELHELTDGGPHLLELLLQFLHPPWIGVCELPAKLALAKAEEQLLTGRLVDRFGGRPRVELGDQRDEVGFGLALPIRCACRRR